VTHKHKKYFGQHFLSDTRVIDAIVSSIHPQPNQTIVEIGPGLGALTRELLSTLPHMDAIEIDTDAVAALHKNFTPEQLTLHAQDVLTFDWAVFCTLHPNTRVAGNLPYNVSVPILLALCTVNTQLTDGHFMVQKEVALRTAATPGHKNFGRLSVMLQYHFDVISYLDIPPSAFTPPPKVDSAMIKLIPHNRYGDCDVARLEAVVKAAFAQRRKTLANTLKGFFTKDELITKGTDPSLRAETLSVEQFVALTH
jgi:16S rRNA (adenine1518-N6/adenine1519-N6)-dimethyltransferase